MPHRETLEALGQRLRVLDEEREQVREELREAVVAARRDRISYQAVSDWTGLGLKAVRLLAGR